MRHWRNRLEGVENWAEWEDVLHSCDSQSGVHYRHTTRVHKAWNCRQSSPHHTIRFNIKKSNPHSKEVSDNLKKEPGAVKSGLGRIGPERMKQWGNRIYYVRKDYFQESEPQESLWSNLWWVCSPTNCGHSGDMICCIGHIPTAWPGLTLWLLLSNEASVLAPELWCDAHLYCLSVVPGMVR